MGVTRQQAGRHLQGAFVVPLLVFVVLGQMFDSYWQAVGGQLPPKVHGQRPFAAAPRQACEFQLAIPVEASTVVLQVLENRLLLTSLSGCGVEASAMLSCAGQDVGARACRVGVAAMQRPRQYRQGQ